jgi:hypothetical protein
MMVLGTDEMKILIQILIVKWIYLTHNKVNDGFLWIKFHKMRQIYFPADEISAYLFQVVSHIFTTNRPS